MAACPAYSLALYLTLQSRPPQYLRVQGSNSGQHPIHVGVPVKRYEHITSNTGANRARVPITILHPNDSVCVNILFYRSRGWDEVGRTFDFYLSKTWDVNAAKHFFRKELKSVGKRRSGGTAESVKVSS
jgi:hypothetical protein